MAKKNQGTSVEKRRRERDKIFKRREKEDRRRARKEDKARSDDTEILVVDPETGLQRVESRVPLKSEEESR